MLKAFYRVPPLLYRLGLGRWIGRRLLVLTTTGRKSGLPRTCGLNYAVDGDVVYVVSGYGATTDWYRNLVADPRVRVRIGPRSWKATAGTAEGDERRRAVALLKESASHQGPPRALRPLIARLGLDYDRELAEFDAGLPDMPVVALRPV